MNSSIFTFEQPRRYWRMPRRAKLGHLALAALLTLMAPLSRYLLWRLYSGRALFEVINSTAVAALSQRTQVLCLGTSHIYCGVRPERYSMPVVNLAAPAMDYRLTESLLHRHLARVPNLKVAVLELDEVPLLYDTLAVYDGDLRYLLALDLSPAEMPATARATRLQNLTAGLLYPFFALPRLTPHGWTRFRDSLPTGPDGQWAAGFDQLDRTYAEGHAHTHMVATIMSQPRDERLQQDNLNALCRSISLLRQRGITVVLLRLPHHPVYWAEDTPYLRNRFVWLRRSLASRYGTDRGVLVWDLGQAAGFADHEFADDHHLNVYGADKLAARLNPRLVHLCRQPAGGYSARINCGGTVPTSHTPLAER